MTIDDNYSQLKDTCLNTCKDIEEIFAPLFSMLKLKGFSLHRLYKDESRIFLSDSPKWIENYFLQNYFSIQNYTNYIDAPTYILWANWPIQDIKANKLIQDAYNNFQYGNALTVVRFSSDYIDVFSLRGYAGDNDVNYRYFTYLDTINKYLDNFLIVGKKIIQQAENTKIKINEKSINKFDWFSHYTDDNSFASANDLIFKDSRLLHPDTGKPFLTYREKECIQGIVRGKSSKEIARGLGISFRTVEQHLINAKNI